MILTLALLLMIVAMFGLIRLYHHLFDTFRLLSTQLLGLKTMITGLRQDLSLDRENVDVRFDQLEGGLQRVGEAFMAYIASEHKKTRKDIQEVKTALKDDEKDNQRQKAQARRMKKPTASK